MSRACIAILLACGALWSADPIRFTPSIALADLSGVSLPVVLTVESATAELVVAPGSKAAPLQHLRVGDTLTAAQFVAGPERVRDCKSAPFDGCVQRTSVWVHARTDGGKTGYCSLSDLRAPLTGRAVAQQPQALFTYAPALTSRQTKVFSIQAKYLPEAGPSFLDRVGWQNVMAKIVSPEGELAASRRELEFLVRQSGGSFSYEAPATAPPMRLNPPLAMLALYDDHAVQLPLSRAVAVKESHYRIPQEAKNAIGMLLLTASGAREIHQDRIKVSTRLYTYKVTTTVVTIRVTAIDLDGDGHPDVIRYRMTEAIPGCNPRTDECGEQTAAMLVLLDHAWYITGGAWNTQEGPEAY